MNFSIDQIFFTPKTKNLNDCQLKFLCATNEKSFFQHMQTSLVCTAAKQGQIYVFMQSVSTKGK